MVRVRYPSDLYHSGIKGMKWGVRRYQNEDGTLTPEGRKRYGVKTSSFTVNKKNWNTKEAQAWVKKASKTSLGITDPWAKRTIEKNVLKNGRSVEFDLDRKRAFKRAKAEKANPLVRYIGNGEMWQNGRLGKGNVAVRVRGKNEKDSKKLRRRATATAAGLGALMLATNGLNMYRVAQDYKQNKEDERRRNQLLSDQMNIVRNTSPYPTPTPTEAEMFRKREAWAAQHPEENTRSKKRSRK